MSDKKTERQGINISAKSFIIAIAVIFAIMILSYILAITVPGGAYARKENGEIISESFKKVDGGIPFWKWILSPILLLGADGSTTVIAIIAFLLVIGGVFECLGDCRMLKYMLDRITMRFGKSKYKLLAAVMFFFMAVGSLVGSFEECVPFVPIVVALAVNLGWDPITGLMMSILAVGCGFSAGVFNPFTVGVAQELAGLRMFSGAGYRALGFLLIYLLLLACTSFHAKRVEKKGESTLVQKNTPRNKDLEKGLVCFAGILGAGIVLVLCSPFIPAIRDYTMIIIAVMFLVAGIVASFVCKMKAKRFFSCFGKGVWGMLPAVLMILMASSVKYTLEQANVLDTVLHKAVGISADLPKWEVVIFIYLLVLVMNFFIASGSAKAFMLIPLIMPIAKLCGVPEQICIMAFAFGDGFSNVYYPTNPVLLISLGLADESYGKWAAKTGVFQLANFLLTSGLLLLGLVIM